MIITIKSVGDVEAQLAKDSEAATKALQYTMKDLRRRGPSQVSKAIRDVYAISAADVKPGGGAVSATPSGNTVAGYSLTYVGRVLSPTHFKLSPRGPMGGRAYTIKATIKKGNRVALGHYKQPGKEGGAHARPNDSPYMMLPGIAAPIKRSGDGYKVMRTVSVPQMVGNPQVFEPAIRNILVLANKRLRNHLNRFLPG